MSPFAYALLVLALYFAPSTIANRTRRLSVFVVNFFFGWTLIGWVIALFMAVRSVESAKGGV